MRRIEVNNSAELVRTCHFLLLCEITTVAKYLKTCGVVVIHKPVIDTLTGYLPVRDTVTVNVVNSQELKTCHSTTSAASAINRNDLSAQRSPLHGFVIVRSVLIAGMVSTNALLTIFNCFRCFSVACLIV
jgi:hypothetical protein